jgi:peroxiredoxin Q/BCP
MCRAAHRVFDLPLIQLHDPLTLDIICTKRTGWHFLYLREVLIIDFLEVTVPIESGNPAPDFELPDETGTLRRLSDFRGKPVVLYFYPKDDTPGCTAEACNFRDDYSAYEQSGVEILGVSPDTVKSHAKFKQKYGLPFPLLADEDRKVCELYGVWALKKLMGREYMGVLRTTFLIDAQGQIVRVFENVKPAEHSAELLSELKVS